MKRFLAAAGAALILTLSPMASAAGSVNIMVNGVPLGSAAMAKVYNNTTYVSLRALSSSLDNSSIIEWNKDTAYVYSHDFQLSARPGENFITVNGQAVSVPDGVKQAQGRTLIPIRTLAQAFNASVHWVPDTMTVSVTGKAASTDESYSEEDLYWLSRIISAESRGEPMEGKIAVGNVVLNRVNSVDFPNTIYDVIFDERWGGQFEPVRNGAVFAEPTEESIEAAKICLNGKNIIGNCLYFIAPALAQNFWVPNNRQFYMTIGCHDFYL